MFRRKYRNQYPPLVHRYRPVRPRKVSLRMRLTSSWPRWMARLPDLGIQSCKTLFIIIIFDLVCKKSTILRCRHNSNGCCVHCSPIEPFDENYLKEQKIKHMSFHAYIRKLTSGVDRGKFVALEDLNCRIRSGCTDHPAWPKGICSKCQPSAITLNRQVYRHVDNVVFENAALVERFLNYWRTTGHQRLGFLYGTYEVHTDVPLGMRAHVAAIYEPPQESTRDSLKLLDDEHASEVDELASALGLKKVYFYTSFLKAIINLLFVCIVSRLDGSSPI